MTALPAVAARDPIPEFLAELSPADRRGRLLRVLNWSAAGIAACAIVAVLLPAPERQRYLTVVCLVLAYAGALPLFASLIQFGAIGLNRFRIGYDRLRPWYPRVAIIVPAWNEADVIGATIERLLAMDYPEDRVRVYVVDDASTDATPAVVQAWAGREPQRVRHLRREKGGQGKAHTLNHGIAKVLAEPWAEALLIIDADVLFEPSALRRMARHLSRPDVGAVTAYIKGSTGGGNYLTRFIAYEYITAQAAARRAQNVIGAMACLAGGAQLHSRESLEAIGGRIDTSTLAEDTLTTFRTQLSGRRVVFDANAVVWAEEPGDIVGLWKQRLRWARGNVQISLQFARMWLRGRRYGRLGGPLFALIWFTIVLLPIFTASASIGLLGLLAMDAGHAWSAFRVLWILHAILYVLVTAMSWALDPGTARRTWLEGVLFPGVISLAIIVYSIVPDPATVLMLRAAGEAGLAVTESRIDALRVFMYLWPAASMLVAYWGRWLAGRWRVPVLPTLLVQIAGYGALLGAVTVAAYIKEIQGAGLAWDKTIKTGKVTAPR